MERVPQNVRVLLSLDLFVHPDDGNLPPSCVCLRSIRYLIFFVSVLEFSVSFWSEFRDYRVYYTIRFTTVQLYLTLNCTL
jgi:hypothetical protein